MGNSEVVYEDIVKVAVDRIPELSGRIEKEFGHYYDLKTGLPEAYPVFEQVLQELLSELIVTRVNDELMKRIFQFLEQMANSADRNVTDLLGIAILEPLVYSQDKIRAAWSFMGERTKELARTTARFGNREQNLPPGEASPGNGH